MRRESREKRTRATGAEVEVQGTPMLSSAKRAERRRLLVDSSGKEVHGTGKYQGSWSGRKGRAPMGISDTEQHHIRTDHAGTPRHLRRTEA